MWRLSPTDEYVRRLKQFAKKNPRELQAGIAPMQVRHGFMHTETHGAIAIDQKGCSGKPMQIRLYAYADADSVTLYLITSGTKKSQRDDNASCREFIVGLRERKQNSHGEHEQRATAGEQTDGQDSE